MHVRQGTSGHQTQRVLHLTACAVVLGSGKWSQFAHVQSSVRSAHAAPQLGPAVTTKVSCTAVASSMGAFLIPLVVGSTPEQRKAL